MSDLVVPVIPVRGLLLSPILTQILLGKDKYALRSNAPDFDLYQSAVSEFDGATLVSIKKVRNYPTFSRTYVSELLCQPK